MISRRSAAILVADASVVYDNLITDAHVRDVLALGHDVVVRELGVMTSRHPLWEDVGPVTLLLVVHGPVVDLAVASIAVATQWLAFRLGIFSS